MACIFRKMPYVFLSINKLHFTKREKIFSAESCRIFCPATLILFALNKRNSGEYGETVLLEKVV